MRLMMSPWCLPCVAKFNFAKDDDDDHLQPPPSLITHTSRQTNSATAKLWSGQSENKCKQINSILSRLRVQFGIRIK